MNYGIVSFGLKGWVWFIVLLYGFVILCNVVVMGNEVL